MHKKRLRTLAISLALLGLAASASAIGFHASTPAAVLGQTLDHVIGVRLDPGETLAPECVSAQVQAGELRLPAGSVSARLEGEGSRLSLRVQTSVVIDEPVLELTVSLGCPTRLSRRFVLFADPAPISAPQVAAALPVVEPQPAAAPVPADRVPAAEAGRPAAAPPRPGAAPATRPRPRAERRAQGAPRSPQQATPVAPSARPRLRLDAVEPEPSQQRPMAEIIEAAASAAAAAAAEQAASAAAARIAALEQSIERLRADSAADRQALLALRQRAAGNDAAAAWQPYLLGVLALLLLLLAWMALKLRQLQRERQQAWWNAAAIAETVRSQQPDPNPPDTLARPLAAAEATGPVSTRPGGAPGPLFKSDPVPDPDLAEPPTTPGERTQAMPVGWREDPEPQRDVSIEELIDLEQQAEFFIVLGQEDAAIDLLVDHLRSTGGGSPMPYLKLLEIYRRRGDHEAYERTRARFNHRFNAYAPDWDSEGHEGRSLEDYPSIVARLQMAWPSPIDAMAELESLLFRKTRGELFDMPAYRDVLFLYSLARDLLDREPLEAGNVDVLLPINEGADHTQPMSLDQSPDTVDSDLVSLDNQPTVPIDLDVTQPVMPESLFGNPTGPARGSRRRR